MNYKKLGNTSLKVSTICLGTMTWGKQNTMEEGFEQMDYALEKGINFFDAAEMYPSPCRKETYGETEKVIGNWLSERKNRDKIILASKVAGRGRMDQGGAAWNRVIQDGTEWNKVGRGTNEYNRMKEDRKSIPGWVEKMLKERLAAQKSALEKDPDEGVLAES